MTPFEFKHAVIMAVQKLRDERTSDIVAQIFAYEANLRTLSGNEAKITSLAQFRRIKVTYLILLEVVRMRSDCPKMRVNEPIRSERKKTENRPKLSLVK